MPDFTNAGGNLTPSITRQHSVESAEIRKLWKAIRGTIVTPIIVPEFEWGTPVVLFDTIAHDGVDTWLRNLGSLGAVWDLPITEAFNDEWIGRKRLNWGGTITDPGNIFPTNWDELIGGPPSDGIIVSMTMTSGSYGGWFAEVELLANNSNTSGIKYNHSFFPSAGWHWFELDTIAFDLGGLWDGDDWVTYEGGTYKSRNILWGHIIDAAERRQAMFQYDGVTMYYHEGTFDGDGVIELPSPEAYYVDLWDAVDSEGGLLALEAERNTVQRFFGYVGAHIGSAIPGAGTPWNSIAMTGIWRPETWPTQDALVEIWNQYATDETGPSIRIVVEDFSDALLNGAMCLVVEGIYAYIAAGSSMVIVNISDPANPTIAGSITDSRLAGAYGIVKRSSVVYVTARSSSVRRFNVVNVGTPATPTVSGSVQNLTVLNDCREIVIGGPSLALVTCGDGDRVVLMNTSNAASPTVVTSVVSSTNLNFPNGIISPQGGSVLVCNNGQGLTVVDYTSTTIAVDQLLGGPNTFQIDLDGSYAWCTNVDDEELYCVEVSNLSGMTFMGSVPIEGVWGVKIHRLNDDYAWAVGRTIGVGTFVYLVYIDNPSEPEVVASVMIDTYTSTNGFCAASNNNLFVTLNSKLYILEAVDLGLEL